MDAIDILSLVRAGLVADNLAEFCASHEITIDQFERWRETIDSAALKSLNRKHFVDASMVEYSTNTIAENGDVLRRPTPFKNEREDNRCLSAIRAVFKNCYIVSCELDDLWYPGQAKAHRRTKAKNKASKKLDANAAQDGRLPFRCYFDSGMGISFVSWPLAVAVGFKKPDPEKYYYPTRTTAGPGRVWPAKAKFRFLDNNLPPREFTFRVGVGEKLLLPPGKVERETVAFGLRDIVPNFQFEYLEKVEYVRLGEKKFEKVVRFWLTEYGEQNSVLL